MYNHTAKAMALCFTISFYSSLWTGIAFENRNN